MARCVVWYCTCWFRSFEQNRADLESAREEAETQRRLLNSEATKITKDNIKIKEAEVKATGLPPLTDEDKAVIERNAHRPINSFKHVGSSIALVDDSLMVYSYCTC